MRIRQQSGYTLIELLGVIGLLFLLFLLMNPLLKCFIVEVPKKFKMAEDEALLVTVIENIRSDVKNCDAVEVKEPGHLILNFGDIQVAYEFIEHGINRYEPWQAEDPNDIEVSSWSLDRLKAEVKPWTGDCKEIKAVNILTGRYYSDQQPYYTYPINHLVFLKGDQYVKSE